MDRAAHPLRNERGVALVLTMLVLTVFLTLAMYGLLFSTLDGRIVTNQTTSFQAFNAAEGGLADALRTINRVGVTQFQQDIVDRWSTLFTPNPRTIPNAPNLTYQVAVAASALDPNNAGTVTVTATGPSAARRIVVAGVHRLSGPDGRGAMYVTSDVANPSLNGAALQIDGNDHDLAGRLSPGGAVKPGIGTRSDTVSASVRGELSALQIPGVRGTGFSLNPLTPSVVATGGPGASDLTKIIGDILARPGVQTLAGNTILEGSTLGDLTHPQITHLTAQSATLDGHVSGAGVLIADGSVRITGTTSFIGWMIVCGRVEVTSGAVGGWTTWGHANVLGSLWTSDLDVSAGGSATLGYSSAALASVDALGGGGQLIPRPMILTSWADVY